MLVIYGGRLGSKRKRSVLAVFGTSLSAVNLQQEDRKMAGKTTKTQLAVRDERERSQL